jgi:uncharacterized protein YegL
MASIDEVVEFASNPQPRCPCALVLDTSGSMLGPKIDALNAGLRIFRNELLNNELARKRVEVAIIEFNTTAQVIQDFATAESFQPPTLTASGTTDMVGGIKQALDLIHYRKAQYKANGVLFYRPWTFLITDGFATNYEQVAQRIREEEAEKRVVFFAVGVQPADLNCLQRISVRPPKMLAGVNFKDMFLWLSSSMGRIAESSLDEKVHLDQPTWEAI